jgi:hypothetical protein
MKTQIAKLIERIHVVAGYERAATCARDCLLEWEAGGNKRLKEVMGAWESFAVEKESNDGHTDTTRHGAWVPVIPL